MQISKFRAEKCAFVVNITNQFVTNLLNVQMWQQKVFDEIYFCFTNNYAEILLHNLGCKFRTSGCTWSTEKNVPKNFSIFKIKLCQNVGQNYPCTYIFLEFQMYKNEIFFFFLKIFFFRRDQPKSHPSRRWNRTPDKLNSNSSDFGDGDKCSTFISSTIFSLNGPLWCYTPILTEIQDHPLWLPHFGIFFVKFGLSKRYPGMI